MNIGTKLRRFGRLSKVCVLAVVVAILAMPMPGASADELASVQSAFDRTFNPSARGSVGFPSAFNTQIAMLANASQGRIGVAAIDLGSGRAVNVLGNQPFPLASTGKIAIAATFLDGVDRGRYRLDSFYPMMVPMPSRKFDGAVAPVRAGTSFTALSLIELSITRSDNQATDALLAAVGGPRAVNAWLRRAGVDGVHLDRDIATLVRDDGAVDPSTRIDLRDSTTPQAMVQLLSGLYDGKWLTPRSHDVLLGAMGRCLTGKRRMRANLPEGATIAHKTGTLYNTSSDVGIITTPDGRPMAVAIYVTGQGTKQARETRIATIARAIYDGYAIPAEGSGPSATLPRTALR